MPTATQAALGEHLCKALSKASLGLDAAATLLLVLPWGAAAQGSAGDAAPVGTSTRKGSRRSC